MLRVTTPAIVLSTLRYGETSRIVRLATRDYGVRSAIAKGALRPGSRFGAALQPMSEGVAHLHLADHRDLHLLTAFDLTRLRAGLAGRMDRFAAASAAAELVVRFGATDPMPETYALLAGGFDLLEAAPEVAVEPIALRVLWQLVCALGFTPSLDSCVRDGAPLPPTGDLAFSAGEGGGLCAACAAGAGATRLPEAGRQQLAAFLDPAADLPALDAAWLAAHRRLLARFIRHHLAEGAELPALDFWLERGRASA